MPVNNSELERYRRLDAMRVLRLLAEHIKVDRDFKPTKAKLTRRVYVSAAGMDWEMLVDGPRFFDLRAARGGGGAIDLVMYLWGLPFKSAVAKLKESGA